MQYKASLDFWRKENDQLFQMVYGRQNNTPLLPHPTLEISAS